MDIHQEIGLCLSRLDLGPITTSEHGLLGHGPKPSSDCGGVGCATKSLNSKGKDPLVGLGPTRVFKPLKEDLRVGPPAQEIPFGMGFLP
jgi:hypothetical protein